MWITRRTAIATGLAAASMPAFASPPPDWAPVLETKFGGHLGVSVLDTANGRKYAHRGDERFSMCSTFKLLAVGAILTLVDQNAERLDRAIDYGKLDLLSNSPVTTAHVAQGHLTIGELCAAAIIFSDNTAANLLLRQIGGPFGVTAYARRLGDEVTHLDRNEPELNRSSPGDDRDATSPNSMLKDLHALMFGNALTPASRALLGGWLAASRTGDTLIRAGIPTNWRRAGKTGKSNDGETNDVAVLYPSENRPAILVAAFYRNSTVTPAERDSVLKEVGRAVAANFG